MIAAALNITLCRRVCSPPLYNQIGLNCHQCYIGFAQDNTYVTDNAYVCLTVCLTGNEELFQQKVLEKLQFTIVRQLQIQNYCNKIVLEGSVCLNPSKSSSVSVRYLKSFFT